MRKLTRKIKNIKWSTMSQADKQAVNTIIENGETVVSQLTPYKEELPDDYNQVVEALKRVKRHKDDLLQPTEIIKEYNVDADLLENWLLAAQELVKKENFRIGS